MNLCIFSIQTVLLTVLVVQYHYTNEVDAELQNVGNNNWYNSVEKQFEAVQNVADWEISKPEVKENRISPKKRKRVVKKNRKRGIKHDHLHVPREQRIDVTDHQDKAYVPKKVVRRIHKKREKERGNQRKFVKTYPVESNSSESDEVKRRKPVDIIVHIKMND